MKSPNRSIPTEEDFARASAAMKERSKGLSEIRDSVKGKFSSQGLHELFVMDCTDGAFKAYIFFSQQSDINRAQLSGLTDAICQAVVNGLRKIGRVGLDGPPVTFEIDSHERVVTDFEGDYFNRLR